MIAVLDTLMVKFKEWDDSRVDAVVKSLGGKVVIRLPSIRWVKVQIDHATASDTFLTFCDHPEVADVTFDSHAERKSVVSYHAPTHSKLVDKQYALKRMNVFRAWKYTRGAGPRPAVLDSGLNFGPPNRPQKPPFEEFVGKDVIRWNGPLDSDVVYDPYTGEPQDALGDGAPYSHGTNVCATIVGNDIPSSGMSGIAPDASLLSLNDWSGYTSDMAVCINMAVDRYGAKFINYSAGEKNPVSTLPAQWAAATPYMVDALSHAEQMGAIVCWAAGNEQTGTQQGEYEYPGSYAATVGHLRVGCLSYEQLDRPIYYSCYGTDVKVAAPGHTNPTPVYQVQTYQTAVVGPEGWVSPDGRYRIARDPTSGDAMTNFIDYHGFNGTSNATPTVVGVLTLIGAANPALTGFQCRDIMLETGDPGQHPEFKWKFPNAVVPNAAKAVMKALTLVPANAGVIYPYVGFYGDGVGVTVTSGVATTHLRGTVMLDIDGFSSDPIVSVQLYADADLIYSGPPKRIKDDNMLEFAAAKLVGKQLRVVAQTATSQADETYSDVVGYAVSSAPPTTSAYPTGGEIASGQRITLTALSDNGPVTIYYRWGTGPWQPYMGPFLPQSGSLEFYGVDALGNVEGGVDYAHL